MHRPAKLVIAGFLAVLGASVHAYVFPSPPPGFGGTPGNWTFAPPPGAEQVDKIMRQPAHLPVPTGGGGNVKLPVSYKLKDIAGRVAGGAVYLNPYVRTAAGIAAWLLAAQLVWDEASKSWKQTQEAQDATGTEFNDQYNQWFASSTEACKSYAGKKTSQDGDGMYKWEFMSANSTGLCKVKHTRLDNNQQTTVQFNMQTRPSTTPGECPVGWTATPAGCLSPALTQPQFEDLISPNPMPKTVPGELPQPTPLPVEQPVVNPTPGPNPTPMPYFVPTGDPVANPQYDPTRPTSPENQPYMQPGVRLTPSPTAAEPWRINVEPVNRPQPTAEPGDPNPETGQPPGDQVKPEETQSLCEKHPDIVACAKMDEVEPEEVNNEDKTLTITPKAGWGNESASCPAPVTKQVAGLALEMSWQPFCDFAGGIRPVVIAMAWLSAALFVLGVARRD